MLSFSALLQFCAVSSALWCHNKDSSFSWRILFTCPVEVSILLNRWKIRVSFNVRTTLVSNSLVCPCDARINTHSLHVTVTVNTLVSASQKSNIRTNDSQTFFLYGFTERSTEMYIYLKEISTLSFSYSWINRGRCRNVILIVSPYTEIYKDVDTITQ